MGSRNKKIGLSAIYKELFARLAVASRDKIHFALNQHTFRMQKKQFLLCALAFLLSNTVLGQAPGPGGKRPPTPVKAVVVQPQSISPSIGGIGGLIANETVLIRPEIAGRIIGIHFKEGQHVAKGALLVTLAAHELKALVAESNSNQNLVRGRYERAQELFKKNFISQQALDEARENAVRAGAQLDQNQARLSKTEIRAPFSGQIGLRQVSLGAVVQAGQDIVRLDDIDTLKLEFRLSESQLSKIKLGQQVSVQVDAFPQQQFTGQVYAIEPGVDEKSRSLMLRARVPNRGGKLRPGLFARVSLQLEGASDSLMIPEQAIVPKGDKAFVYRIVDNAAELVPVTLGARRPGEVAIASGLKAGDLIVTEGHQKLGPGAAVSVVK